MPRRHFKPIIALATAAILLVAPAASRATTSLPLVPGAQRVPGGWAVPLATRAPSWFDAAYYRKVLNAGTKGARIPLGASVPDAFGLTTPGIHPGSWIATVVADARGFWFGWCSTNFVFKRGSVLAIGTAGHCASKDSLGQWPDVTAYVLPPKGLGAPGFFHIGKFILSHNGGIGDDFALIQLYPQFRSWVDPTMPLWGGPTGIYRSTTPTVVEWFGNALGFGAGGTPRAGYAPVWNVEHGRAFAFVGPSLNGDSGSGVITQSGAAAGDLTHLIYGTPPIYGQLYPAMMAGTLMSRILQIAKGWSLVNGSAALL